MSVMPSHFSAETARVGTKFTIGGHEVFRKIEEAMARGEYHTEPLPKKFLGEVEKGQLRELGYSIDLVVIKQRTDDEPAAWGIAVSWNTKRRYVDDA